MISIMKKYVYIKLSVSKHYLEYEAPLSAEEYDNIGETWQDYVDNKFVPLSEEQVAFRDNNPTATVKEVWDMELTPPHVRTLDEAKREKIMLIEEYDRSEAVNSFTIGNQAMWLTVGERQQLETQVSSSEAIGRTTMTRWYGGEDFTFSLDIWKQMLVALEIYAGDSKNVTEAHKAAVNALETIEEVDNFDITVGYPDKLSF
jgi:hypothetical protein